MMTTVQAEKVREAVLERYGTIATSYVGQEASCCGPDAGNSSCCSPSLYDVSLEELPTSVTDLSLGCGDPITLASLQPGQVVLDLGSGAGIDCFLAAQRVGESGRVIGVDMTPAMLEKAAANKAKLNAGNVEFRHGQIEALPLEDTSIEVIISNCVINLSPDKPAVFREAFRVLKPGGKLAVSDMVTQGHFTAAERSNMAAWSECIAGAEDVADYVAMMQVAGFNDISVRDKAVPNVELANTLSLPGMPARLFSASITAWKK